MVTNYLAYPQRTTKHLDVWGIHVDIQNQRAIVLADAKNPGYLALTTVEDVSNIVAKAIEYEGKWPEIGGIRGDEVSMPALIEKCERVQGTHTLLCELANQEHGQGLQNSVGHTFSVEGIKSIHARMGRSTTSWCPEMGHPSVQEAVREASARIFTAKTVYSVYQGTWRVSDEWNQLLPDYQFTSVDAFLERWWATRAS